MKNLQYCSWCISRFFLSFLLNYFTHKSLWCHVRELDFKSRLSDIWWSEVLILTLGQLIVPCKENFHEKNLFDSLFIIFEHLNFGHYTDRESALLTWYWSSWRSKGHQEPRNEFGSQVPAEHISRVWTGNLRMCIPTVHTLTSIHS